MVHPKRQSLEKRLRNSDIDASTVQDAKFDENDVVKRLKNEHDKSLEVAEEMKEEVMYSYYDFLDDGFEDVLGTLDMSIRRAEQHFETEARRVEAWREDSGNKHAEHMAISAVEDELDDFMDIMVDGEPSIEKAKDKFDTVRDNISETNWSAVRSEIQGNLEKGLRDNDEVHMKIRNIIDTHTKYDYSETDVWRFTDEIIKEITERRSNEVVGRLIDVIDSEELHKERRKMKEEVEESIVKSTLKSVVSESAAELTAKGIAKIAPKIAVLVASAAAGVAIPL